MLNEVILACKTYDIMRYYHVKEMSLSYDCVLVLSLIESVQYQEQNILFLSNMWNSYEKVLYAERSKTELEYSPHHSAKKWVEKIQMWVRYIYFCNYLTQIQCQGRSFPSTKVNDCGNLYETFYILHLQKRIIAVTIIPENTVCRPTLLLYLKMHQVNL